MSEINKYDICVIGAGPGGYVAAIHAGRSGKKVLLVEKSNFGGTCLNVGCIPTKTLLASAETLHSVRNAGLFGIEIGGEITVNWQAMQNRKQSVVEKLRVGIAGLLKNANVSVITGDASFLDKQKIEIAFTDGTKEEIFSEKFIIATGSAPSVPSFIPKSPRILDSTSLLGIQTIPKSLLVLGGGVIGCEFASLFAELGAEVTIVEMMPSILPEQDEEISSQLGREFKKKKIKLFTGKPLENIKVTDEFVLGTIGGKEVSAEYLLVSIGRIPVSSVLNLDKCGVSYDKRGFIPVNNKCETNVDGIYAIGDVTGRIQLAHMASAMGVVAAENSVGAHVAAFSDKNIPGCIFTSPEIGSVGMTEQACNKFGMNIKIGKFPFSALGKSMAINETAGFCKIIVDVANDKVVGVHIIGPHATDLISEAVTAIELGATAEQIGNAVHAHPTLGEAMMEAAHAVHEKCAHMPILKKKI